VTARAVKRVVPASMVVIGALLTACSSAGDDVAASPTPPAVTSDASSITIPAVPPTSIPALPAPIDPTDPTAPSGPTTTTEPPPGVDEPARRGTASALERPTGFARFEPEGPFTAHAPLTGLAADPAIADRAALAVKIDNAPQGQPQFNLADADLVFEENVEGVTRFVAVYHTNMPDRIGPVRSARTSDLDILAGLNRPILAWSGGNAAVTTKIRGAHEFGWLANLSAQRTDCFWRSATRGAPHNLMLDPICARDSATFAGPARSVFTHGYGEAPSGGVPTRDFTVAMSGITPEWRWDSEAGRYLRSQRGARHVDVDGERIGAENVVVLEVKYVTSEADAQSPEAVTVGFGPATVHRDGVAIAGTWSRVDRFAPYTLLDIAGDPLPLAPGTTFVELPRRRD
jgi:hypothetical protein